MRRSSARIRPRCDGPAAQGGQRAHAAQRQECLLALATGAGSCTRRRRVRVMMAAKSVKPRGTYSVSLAFFHMLSCQREGLMRLPQVILAAAISLGCAAAAAAAPLIPMPPGLFSHANSGI